MLGVCELKKNVIRVEKRLSISPQTYVLVVIIAIALALLVGAIFIKINGFNPWEIYVTMFKGSFGSVYGLSETVVKSIPLMLAGLGVAIASRMLLWNIGGEGQIYMGAFAAGWVALFGPQLPAVFMIPLVLLAGFIGGALWSFIPAFLRAKMGVNEIITTLMFNYIAILWMDYLVFGPWRDPNGFNQPLTAKFPASAMLPVLPGTRIHLGVLLALAAAVILYFVLMRTRWGYEVRVTGESQNAARYAGMNTTRNIILVLMLSGGLAGLAGTVEVTGVLGRLQQGISPGYGYTAILIAVLAKLNPFSVVLVSFLFGGLLVGGYTAQTIGVSMAIVYMLQGAIIFFVLAGEAIAKYSVRFERREEY